MSMCLPATSMSYSLPRSDFRGQIHSVFQHACNLRLEGGGVVTLLSAGYGNLPQGICLESPPGFYFTTYLVAGCPFSCRNALIDFEGLLLSVDLQQAEAWRLDLGCSPADFQKPAVRQAWQLAGRLLQEEASPAGLSAILAPDHTGALAEAARCHIPRLLEATRDRRVDQAAAAVASLVGLGPGLTPAGDDFLVGYLAGLWNTAAAGAARHAFLKQLVNRSGPLIERTNEISRTYLRYAMKGEVSEVLGELALAIGRGDDASHLLPTARAALQVGSTSGPDGVLGLLLGMAAWQGEEALTGMMP